MKDKPKVLIIGLDGATFDLILPWTKEGRLPNLARLLQDGAWGQLRSVPNMNSAPAWSSFATGKNPGKHGIFYFDEPIPGTYRKRYLNGGFRHGETFWSVLSRAGHRVGVINVPMTYPAEPVNGFVLAGLDTPGVDSPGFSYPPELFPKLKSRLGEYIIEPGIPGHIKAGRKDLALTRLLQEVGVRLTYTRYLMESEPWDLLVVVFTASDNAHHFFWKDMDPAHPEHDPKSAKIYGGAIRQVYEKLDWAVGQLIAAAPRATVMVMSDHGGGFNQRGAEYLNPWLQELGLLTYVRGDSHNPAARLSRLPKSILSIAYRQVDKKLSREAKLRLTRLLPGVREKVEATLAFPGIDWAKTKAYAHGARDDIWINLAGREPQGTVQAGKEYEEVRDFIIAQLHETRDVATGQPVVEAAQRREEVYHGELLGKAPDILIRWRTDSVIRRLWLPRESEPRPAVPPLVPSPISGGHRLHGIFLLRGRGVKPGHEIHQAQILDLAPTVLWLFGQPIPEDMDGKVLAKAFAPDYLQANPIAYGLGEEKEAAEVEYSAEDAAEIEKRLRGLGYIP